MSGEKRTLSPYIIPTSFERQNGTRLSPGLHRFNGSKSRRWFNRHALCAALSGGQSHHLPLLLRHLTGDDRDLSAAAAAPSGVKQRTELKTESKLGDLPWQKTYELGLLGVAPLFRVLASISMMALRSRTGAGLERLNTHSELQR